ncbi:methyl-accepting chemotaxis protein [Burkholderia sp. lig30]|jgi:methyl-accepting chemotaxis protein|uniref:methyl-accepting chemotaxis protein n=1 Tax=Burkholderia sp. lig30 TaxID=1192124 RepID=UPI0005721F35|nr:methyl-accepting chemotaxis protein [Burkholderia sp. lig30]
MKVFNKLLIAFLAVVAMLVGTGGFGIYQVSQVNDRVLDVNNNWLPSVRLAGQMRSDMRQFRVSEIQHILSTSDADMSTYEKEISDVLADFQQADSQYAKLISDANERQAYDDFKKNFDSYLNVHTQIAALSRQNKKDEALQLARGEAQQYRKALDNALGRIVEINVKGADGAGEAAAQAYASSRLWLMIVIGFAAVVGVALAYLIARDLTKQLGGEPADAARLAGEVAAGNLEAHVALQPNDRTSLMYSLVSMKEQLAKIVLGIKSSSGSIAVAAGEIAQGNTDLSQRTEEQAASLEETAASMEELTATVRQTADNATQAATLAGNASDVAARGGDVVGRVVETMRGISESSSKVAEIITVIDGIAFQTNILALNAAVEAARAGEQGRGFAVVAGEVRTLAQRSAVAAKEIKALIEESVERVDLGTRLVADAGHSIEEIVQSVKRMTDIMGEISSASIEQRTGIEQVNTAVTQMDEVTQQNAALVEEATAAARSMAEQADGLRDAVAIFRVGGEPAVRATREPARPKPVSPVAKKPAASRRESPVPAASPMPAPALAEVGDNDWATF